MSLPNNARNTDPSSTQSDNKEGDVSVMDIISDFIQDVSIAKLALGAVMGAVGGVGLSLVNQTIVNPPKQITLPMAKAKLKYLRDNACDLLYAINEFYEFRRFVDRNSDLPKFDQAAEELVNQSTAIVALYNHIRLQRQKLGYTEQFLAVYSELLLQVKDHMRVVLAIMRRMTFYLTQSEMILVQKSFNNLYTLHEDRLYKLNHIVQGAAE